MAFDGLVIKSIISELNKCIIGGKINKVFQPTKNDIILSIYSNGMNYALQICIDSSNYRINLTTKSKANPVVAHNFCMFLRKHTIGSRIRSISSIDLERIVIIELEGYNELNDLITKKLVIELMGKHSNIILLNSNDIILNSLRQFDKLNGSHRDIIPTRTYIFPVTTKSSMIEIEFNNFYKLLIKENIISISNAISNLFIGISKTFTNYTTNILNIKEINEQSLNQLFKYLKEIIKLSYTGDVSCIQILNSNNKDDFTLIKSKDKGNLDINSFIDEFYYRKESLEMFLNYRNNLLKSISNLLNKYNKRLENINIKLEECFNMEKYKKYGELITAYLYKIKNENMSFLELEDYYDNNNLIKIPLDSRISPSSNAKNFFKKYHKLKNTLSIVEIQKNETKKELDYIESIIYELETAKCIEDVDDIYREIQDNILKINPQKASISTIKSSKNSKIIPIEYEIDGFKILVGKNNKQNDYITFKLAKNEDIWMHTKDIPGSHVIIKINNKKPNEETLIKCAKIAAKHSKANNSSNVPVDYTCVKYVKKPRGSKPGKVIYTNQKAINV